MRYIALDTETKGLAAKLDAAIPVWCAAFSERGKDSYCLPWNAAKHEIERLLDDPEVTFVFWNAAFDVAVLRVHGVDVPPGRYNDGMVMSYVWEPAGEHSLREWGIRLGMHKGDFHDFESGYSDEMASYCITDTQITLTAFEELKTSLESDPEALDLYLDVELPFIEVIIEMESVGLYIDKKRLPEARQQIKEKLFDIHTSIETLIPEIPGKLRELKKKKRDDQLQLKDVRLEFIEERPGSVFVYQEYKPFNPNSGDQIAQVLMSQGWEPKNFSETGKPQTGAGILEDLDAEKYPVVPYLLENALLSKIDGTFLSAFDEMSDEHSVLRGSFNQCITLTGRLSSSKPNLQNIPTKGELGQLCRSLVCTPNPEKLKIVSGDLSNIEGRVLAAYLLEVLDDDRLAKVFQKGEDFHSSNAELIGVTRSVAKTLLYAIAYGAGFKKIARTLSVSEKEAKRVMQSLNNKFPALPKLKQWSIEETKRNKGVFHTKFGRRLVYKSVLSSDSEKSSRSERQIFNAVLQGTAADIIKKLTIDSFDLIYEYGGRIAASVHDELLIYCPAGTAQELAETLTSVWSSSDYLGSVPITAEFKIGNTWGEIH